MLRQGRDRQRILQGGLAGPFRPGSGDAAAGISGEEVQPIGIDPQGQAVGELDMRAEDGRQGLIADQTMDEPLGTQLPSESEIQSCQSYLFKQLELIKPKVVMPLGGEAYEMLTGDTTPFEQVRGRQIPFGAISIVPIYHPSFLLRNPSLKKLAMQDLQKIKELL